MYSNSEGIKIIAPFSCILALSILLISNDYIAITSRGIEIHDLIPLKSVTYSYSEFQAIEKAPKFETWLGKEITRNIYLIRLNNGESLSSNDSILEIDLRKLRVATEYMSIKSGIPVVEKDIFTQDELPQTWIGWKLLYYLYHPLEAFQD